MKFFVLMMSFFISLESMAFTKNAMAPLVINDFSKFEKSLIAIKSLGADAISTDIWWGLVEKEDNQFDWTHYQKISDLIIKHGLKWVPILSTHQCGGNVGDNCNIPIPSWLWSKYHVDLRYKSEQGNFSTEVISSMATPIVLEEYRDLYKSFKANFYNKRNHIQEINISLGPAGELRYPSYNSHDHGSGYPSRGALQAYSPLAIDAFRDYIVDKYKNIDEVNRRWGFSLHSFDNVFPPNGNLFFANKEQTSNYGHDFYDWYSLNLRQHGQLLLGAAISEFRSMNIKVGAKIPGVHWRLAPGSDRLAEMNAGLINSRQYTWSDDFGHGYEETIKLFSTIKRDLSFEGLVLHFTCLEKDNYEGGPHANSFAKALVFWIGKLAGSHNVEIKGENALAGVMQSERSWFNIQDALIYGGYTGITILRMDNVLESHTSREAFRSLYDVAL